MQSDDRPATVEVPETAIAEVLAYLVTSARTQIDEAAEYGPLRLLTAAGRLADIVPPTASEALVALATALKDLPPTAVPRRDRQDYVDRVDALCSEVAMCLLTLHPAATP